MSGTQQWFRPGTECRYGRLGEWKYTGLRVGRDLARGTVYRTGPGRGPGTRASVPILSSTVLRRRGVSRSLAGDSRMQW